MQTYLCEISEMILHETTEKQFHSGAFYQTGFIFRGKKTHTFMSHSEKRVIRCLVILMLVLMTGKLGSICPPSAPPKPRPASSVNQTLVQGLGETEMDRQTEE